jgi:hypothetical protein
MLGIHPKPGWILREVKVGLERLINKIKEGDNGTFPYFFCTDFAPVSVFNPCGLCRYESYS